MIPQYPCLGKKQISSNEECVKKILCERRNTNKKNVLRSGRKEVACSVRGRLRVLPLDVLLDKTEYGPHLPSNSTGGEEWNKESRKGEPKDKRESPS